MTRSYREELVYSEAEDGVVNAGLVLRPEPPHASPIPILWVHGFAGRFYERHALKIGRELASRGHVFISGNNRGHDFGAALSFADPTRESRLGGGCWERLEESPSDVAGWVRFAVESGFPGVVLLGHSLGGVKVIYYQVERQDPRVSGVIVASGPIWRLPSPRPEVLALARQMVAEGRGQDLLPWGSRSGPMGTVSAHTQVSRIAVGAALRGTGGEPAALARIDCPLFLLLGSEEPWLGTRADLDACRRSAGPAARIDTRLFQGADHFYRGREAEVAEAISAWSVLLKPAPAPGQPRPDVRQTRS